MSRALDIGIAADLRPEEQDPANGPDTTPDDRYEECDSQSTVDAIAAALGSLGHRPRFLGSGRRFLEEVLSRPPELVFNIAEGSGSRSREAHVPAVCEMLGIPFTGSDPLTLAATLDKAVGKRLVAAAGLATPRFAVVEDLDEVEGLALAFPVIAKPLREGSSIGIRRGSRADEAEALARDVGRLLADYDEPVLVEEFLPGAEFTVAVLGGGKEARVLGVMEIVPRAGRTEDFVYSLEVKRNFRAEVDYHVPPMRSAKLVRDLETLALGCVRALGCRDLSRVDLRLSRDGEPHFLEANPLPGLAPGKGDVVILTERAGIRYVELIDRIVQNALARSGERGAVSCASA